MPAITVQLSRPLRVVESGARGPTRERIIAEVTLREPIGRDLLLFDRHRGQPVELALALVQALSGLTKVQVGKLAATDLEALGRAALNATTAGPAIGAEAASLVPPCP